VAASLLTAYWIRTPFRRAPLGFGVTARSFDDAVKIMRALGYGCYLPEDLSLLDVREGVTFAELDQLNVVPNMGPIVVRGMWYPFVAVGMPAWANP
jgi:hypothetical protein